MFKVRAVTALDGYKTGHIFQYPKGTEDVYSNWTPRSGKYSKTGLPYVVWFGLQSFIKAYLIDCWNETFFCKPKDEIVSYYKKRMDTYLGPGAVPVDHIAALHDLGYLPIEIKALPEGTKVPYGVPCMTIHSTDPRFFWVVNYIESVMSTELWRMSTSATTAYAYYKNFKEHADRTGGDLAFLPWQGHDFSFRGMGGISDSAMSGAGHLLSFWGTDTIPAIEFLEDYYCADAEKEIVAGSVPASEHSVMSMGSMGGEFDTFKKLITEIYPSGVLSIVSDTWDLWKVILQYMPALREEIMARDGRVVIRPDSSPKTPLEVICGDSESRTRHEQAGVYELLWDIFGGTVNDKGYKVLDGHVGVIYGEAINLDMQKAILDSLEKNGFCAQNLVLGIGSFTYAYTTRDAHGWAMKTTAGIVNGKLVPVFKDPVTDPGFKKSAVGLIRVVAAPGKDAESLRSHDMVSPEEERGGLLRQVFIDGRLAEEDTLSAIRKRLGALPS